MSDSGSPPPPAGPLAGLKVLDFSRLLPGPYGTTILADLGADVVKIEDPGAGDYLRALPPFVKGESAPFAYLNRGKRALVLDLKKEEGHAVARRLAAGTDVLVESFRPGVMSALGLGWEDLRGSNEKLVYCSISGYGQTGPLRSRAGHDLNYIALSGLLSLCGEAGGSPVPPGVQVADLAGGGLWAIVAILAALREAESSGKGQFLDVSMTAGVQGFLGFQGAEALARNRPLGLGESLFSGFHPAFRVYACSDGKHLAVAALEDKFWRPFAGAIGIDDVPTVLTLPSSQWAGLVNRVASILSTRDREEWLHLLTPLDCCVDPVLDVVEAFEHPQSRHRNMTWETPLRVGGNVSQPGFPVQFSRTAPRPPGQAPGQGEHGHEILREAGFSEDEIEDLKSRGTFGKSV